MFYNVLGVSVLYCAPRPKERRVIHILPGAFRDTEIACSSITIFCQNVSFTSMKSPLGEMAIENDVFKTGVRNYKPKSYSPRFLNCPRFFI